MWNFQLWSIWLTALFLFHIKLFGVWNLLTKRAKMINDRKQLKVNGKNVWKANIQVNAGWGLQPILGCVMYQYCQYSIESLMYPKQRTSHQLKTTPSGRLNWLILIIQSTLVVEKKFLGKWSSSSAFAKQLQCQVQWYFSFANRCSFDSHDTLELSFRFLLTGSFHLVNNSSFG